MTHLAYLVICTVAWVWALSQLRYAIAQGQLWPPPWRLTAGLWLAAKAFFISFVGWAVWDDMDDRLLYRAVVYGFAIIHVWAFVQWATLPGQKPMAEPPMQYSDVP